ncbi:unnamed protein product [Rotaria sp. Silwood1]|nr:unnamed protein product [Rotaria sp. Silwood1]
MSEKGTCTDITCDDEIKELYQCHCCLQLVCLTHLIQHVEIRKQYKQRLDSLRNELNTGVNTLNLIVEEKLFIIKREQNMIEQAKQLLNISNSTMDELQNSFEQINQAIVSNHSDIAEEVGISEDDRRSTYVNHDVMNTISFNEKMEFDKDQHINEEQKKSKRKSCRTIIDECPLTFDGAYGLTQTNHSIKFCEYEKDCRFLLYDHFIRKHKLKEVCAQRLLEAVADNHDPRTTKLFDENESIIDYLWKVPCPFINGRLDLPEYRRKYLKNIPCSHNLIRLDHLKKHLRCHHRVYNGFAQKLVDVFKAIRSKYNTTTAFLIPST